MKSTSMTRTERLLHLMQTLRRQRHPVKAQTLATELSISIRTLYRDIETLRNQGADIIGEPGIGYQLRHDSTLPPLMFQAQELEAVVLGMRWASIHAEPPLAEAAKSALAKIRAVLPPSLADGLAAQMQYPLSNRQYSAAEIAALAAIRQALRECRVLTFAYTDAHGEATQRSVWPISIAYFEQVCLLAAWCELRQNFRHFRTDRIHNITLGKLYPVPHQWLWQQWQQHEADCMRLDKFEP